VIPTILLVIVSMLFTVLAFRQEEYVSKLVCLSLAVVGWLGAAAESVLIRYPYSHLYENAVDNTYQVITGSHVVLEQGIPWMFMAIAVILVAYGFFWLSGRVFR